MRTASSRLAEVGKGGLRRESSRDSMSGGKRKAKPAFQILEGMMFSCHVVFFLFGVPWLMAGEHHCTASGRRIGSFIARVGFRIGRLFLVIVAHCVPGRRLP